MGTRGLCNKTKTKCSSHKQNKAGLLSGQLSRFENDVLTTVPNFRVSERHAFLMARKVIDGLRKAQTQCKRRHDSLANELVSRNLGNKSFKHVRQTMLANLGAVQLDSKSRKHCVVHYIEVGGERDDTIYLCTSSCQRRNPLESWGYSKRVAVTRYALERAFLRGCIWAKGTAITLSQIAKELFGLYWSYSIYQEHYSDQSKGLFRQGWNMNLCDDSTQYIVRFDGEEIPVVMTVFKADLETPEGGLAKMIPPQGSFDNPKLVASLHQLGQQQRLSA
jgi:hypothetical protein